MHGLMMDFPLTLHAIFRRAEALFGSRAIVSRCGDRSLHRYTYADFVRRAKKLAVALQRLGVEPGTRVATLCWNHHAHLEAYFGIPLAGGILHTLNLRLHPDDLTHIVNDAADRVILVDCVLLPLLEKFRARLKDVQIVVISPDRRAPAGMLDYETILEQAEESTFSPVEPDEREAAAMCYTSGTTGRPKGVLYSHRGLALHSMAFGLVDVIGLNESDTVLPVVPMFHVNAWGVPFAGVMVGAKLVFPGMHLDPSSLAELYQNERVTITLGVPTIWMALLKFLDQRPGPYDLSSLRALVVGGSAAPKAMIQGFEERHGLRVIQAWGMTETTPLGTACWIGPALEGVEPDRQYAYRAKQGRPAPFVEIRGRGPEGLIPWDGKAMGELEVRGPWIASAYYNQADGTDRFAEDGWLRTGDIVTIDPLGYMEIQDRAKDLVKSGGEWISSVSLENALMGHPAVAEAAVIPVPHPYWQERPLAVVVLKEGAQATADELREFLAPHFASWWLPDAIEFVEQIPRTSTGKFLKAELRKRYRDYRIPDPGTGQP